MATDTITAFSKRDPNSGADLLGNCTMVLIDGTHKIEFVNGRAEVPVGLEEAVLTHPHVEIPGYKPDDAFEDLGDEDSDAAPVAAGPLEAETADGQPRCQAVKADGSQCANPVTDGAACAIAKHREQIA